MRRVFHDINAPDGLPVSSRERGSGAFNFNVDLLYSYFYFFYLFILTSACSLWLWQTGRYLLMYIDRTDAFCMCDMEKSSACKTGLSGRKNHT